jgi:hypothetical protein
MPHWPKLVYSRVPFASRQGHTDRLDHSSGIV